MKAVILAGGKGERLRPMTCARPKPLVNFMDGVVLDGILSLLKRHGVAEAAVTTMYMPQQMEDYARNNGILPLTCVREQQPLGTAGAVKNCAAFLNSTFLVLSGDCVTDIDLDAAVRFHKEKGAEATLVMIRQENPLDFGVVCCDATGAITGFAEKPSWSEVESCCCNSGIYILEPSVLQRIDLSKAPVDFAMDVFPAMLKEGAPIFALASDAYWCDIGDEQKYRGAHFDCLDGKCNLFAPKNGKNVRIGEGAVIRQPVCIGDNSVIEGASVIGPYTVIGKNCTIRNSTVAGSMVWDNAQLSGTEVYDSVLCSGVRLQDASRIGAGSVIGENCVVGRFASIKSGCRLWMDTIVEDETEVCMDQRVPAVVRRPDAASMRSLSISDMSPEGMLLLARAFAVGKKSVLVCADCSKLSASIASLVLSGVSLSGATGIQSDCGSLGQTRFAVRYSQADAGIYVRSERGAISVSLLDERGCDFGRRELQGVTRIMSSSVLPKEEGEIYSVQMKNRYYEYLVSLLCARPQGKQIALSGNETAVDYAAEALRKTGWTPIKAGNRPIAQVIKENSCMFGAVLSPAFLVTALYDERGRKVSYEQFLWLRAQLCIQAGARTVILPCDCSEECEQSLKRNAEVKRSKDNSASGVASASWADSLVGKTCFSIILDAVVFMLSLSRYILSKHNFLSNCLEELPQSFSSVVRCPNRDKGRVMEEVKKRKLKARIIPDESLAVLKIYASALSTEYARELALDAEAIINETVQHGQS